jgi:hypothetical protein
MTCSIILSITIFVRRSHYLWFGEREIFSSWLIWRIAVRLLNKHSRTTDNVQAVVLELGSWARVYKSITVVIFHFTQGLGFDQ